MSYMKKDDFTTALDLLLKSEKLCSTNEQGKAITYNNLACYYRRIGKLKKSLEYLEKALDLKKVIKATETIADTHLNICAVLSQLGKHEQALEHAMAAIILLQEEMLNCVLKPDNPKPTKDKYSILAIAYHNMGVEQEFMKRNDTALVSYRKAIVVAQTNIGPDDPITKNLVEIYNNAKKEVFA